MTSVTLDEAREAIQLRWETQWAGATPFWFDNEKAAPPTDAPWVDFRINHEGGEQDSMGSVGRRKYTRRGRVLAMIRGPINAGTRSLDALAISARNIFEGAQFSGLYFISADIREAGQDGEWFMLIVDAPFDYQETK